MVQHRLPGQEGVVVIQKRWDLGAAILGLAITPLVDAQNCVKPADSDWEKVVLVNGASPMKLDKPVSMSILPDGRVFLCEMWSGKIKLFTPGAGLSEAGSLTVHADGTENGLLGVAADPDFATNNWVYVFFSRRLPGATYSAGDGGVAPHEHVLVRMTFANGKLGNPKDILKFNRLTKRHAAGGIYFDNSTGELYIPTGDDVYPSNTATHWGGRLEGTPYLNDLGTSANTNDLRGKVLRIKPLPFADSETPSPGVGTTYSIPAGNLFPVGMEKARPEIYTMGHRNPYKVKVDPVSGFALVGEVGPDANGPDPARGPTGSDEFNLLKGSGNYGWPFAIADNQPYVAFEGEAYTKGTTFDLQNLKNLSAQNTGIQDLPPAIGALAYYNARNSQTGPNTVFGSDGESAIAGPYYRYDATKPNVRMPAFFHGKFIVGDFVRHKIWLLEMDENHALKKVDNLWTAHKVIDLDIGPDGDLYVLTLGEGGTYEGNPNSGNLYKMQFKGTHYAASSCPQAVFAAKSVSLQSKSGSRGNQATFWVNLASPSRFNAPAGATVGRLFDVKGKLIWEGRVRDGQLALPSIQSTDLGFLNFR